MKSFPADVYEAALKLEPNCWLSTLRVPLLQIQSSQFWSSWVNRPHQQQRFGNLSYLKETQDLPPSTRVITLPQHNGKVKSIVMQTLIKWPPSSSTAPMDLWTSPTVSHKHSAISFVMYLRGMSWNCTQNVTFLKSMLCARVSESYLWITTKCLLKLHG